MMNRLYPVLTPIVLWLLCLGTATLAQDNKPRRISGIVLDDSRRPLIYVNLFIKGSYDGDVSDSTGTFEFQTTLSGEQTLVASFMGFERTELTLMLDNTEVPSLTITMREEAIKLQEATITASSFSAGNEKGTTLKAMDIITTPGAGADIFKAIQTFPGVSAIDDGSGLFIRGGDVSETVTILDQATVVHPYRYESPTGGAMGSISPFLVSGTFFTSGGFSAKYGNALSGVLAMQGLGRPGKRQGYLGIGLAATSVGLDLPIDSRVSVRFSGNYSATGPMFRLNGRHSEFTRHPGGGDANLAVLYDHPKTGRFRFFTYLAETRVGVKVPQPSFDGVYQGTELNQLHNLQWKRLLNKRWLVQAGLSLNRFKAERSLGVLDLLQHDNTYKFRIDIERHFSSKFTMEFGGEHEKVHNRFLGQYPDSDVLDPNAARIEVDNRFGAFRTGAYWQGEIFVARGTFINAGLRTDHHNLAGQVIVDPRASIFYQVGKNNNIRLSYGIYHQFAAPSYYQTGFGNPDLRAQRADHYVAGYEHNFENALLKAELYHKAYKGLVLEDQNANFLNRGYGYARGIDLFYRWGDIFKNKVNGRIAYSFLRSKRLQVRHTADGELDEYAPSPLDITHNLTIVARYSLTSKLTFGTQVRFISGRPMTPIVDSIRNPDFAFHTPIEGHIGSERLPAYHRADINLSYLRFFKGGRYAVFYAAVSNVTNSHNILGYDYSFDYTERQPRKTNYARFYYFGLSLTLR